MDLLHQIIAAVKSSDAGRLRELLREDPRLVNARDETGDSILIMAIYQDSTEIREIILSAHPQINVFEAAAIGDTTVIERHLASFPELVHSFSHDGFTPLHLAAFFNRGEAARHLLDRQADVNAVSKNQTFARAATPLHIAALRGDAGLVTLLLGAGADRAARNDDGKTPADLAREKGFTEIEKVLA